jgi:hypothetical protein
MSRYGLVLSEVCHPGAKSGPTLMMFEARTPCLLLLLDNLLTISSFPYMDTNKNAAMSNQLPISNLPQKFHVTLWAGVE